MTGRTCPDCRRRGTPPVQPAGPHPAGRCDDCHRTHERRRTACVDCWDEGLALTRPTYVNPKTGKPAPGNRCATHWRELRREQRTTKRIRRLEENFDLSMDDYQAIYESQGGRCYGCRVATGARKALAVDHEHNRPGCDHDPKKGCYLCIRALLCGQCNQILGRYGVDKLRRLIEVIEDPPARKVLMSR